MDSRHQAHRVADGELVAKVAGCGEPYSGHGERRMRTPVWCASGVEVAPHPSGVWLCAISVRSVRGGADAAGRPSMGSGDAFRRSDVSESRDGEGVLAQK